MPDESPRRGGWLRILTGTSPGLERFLLAAMPALVAGSVGYFTLGPWPGLLLGAAVLFLVAWWARRLG